MAESYFELLTENRGFPAKTFEPLEELKRIRRGLALRLQNLEPAAQGAPLSLAGLVPHDTAFSPAEPTLLESVVEQVGGMKNTLAIWQRSRTRSKTTQSDIFRGDRKPASGGRFSLADAEHPAGSQEGMLDRVNAGLTALGVIGVVFGFLSFFRGWESDLSLGSMVCLSGASIVAIGLCGNFLAMRAELS